MTALALHRASNSGKPLIAEVRKHRLHKTHSGHMARLLRAPDHIGRRCTVFRSML
jgi:hypothetical protein